MDKQILKDYIDACAQVKETKEQIRKLRKARKQMVADTSKGSAHEFPYTVQTYHLEGLSYPTVKDPVERLQTAERIKRDVEAWMNTIPMRMQRIIRYRIFEDLPWGQVAVRMGRRATEASVKMEYLRFMGEK